MQLVVDVGTLALVIAPRGLTVVSFWLAGSVAVLLRNRRLIFTRVHQTLESWASPPWAAPPPCIRTQYCILQVLCTGHFPLGVVVA